ncbi:hypothetical protein [Streptomyces parvus]|nr:hypothetical protein [Streptomyces parvus]
MVMQPVLEILAADDFALWPVGEHESYGYLVTNAQQDVRDFLGLAGAWAEQHLPAHAAPVTAALARALDLASSP